MEEEMELIERYLNQARKHLPAKGKEDILKEMRSHLEDTLDQRTGGNPSEEDVVTLLKECGSPQKMAASYHPQGQYLIGPALYPLFRMLIGIALAATLGAQLLAGIIALWAGNNFEAAEFVAGLINSVPMVLGWVVIVFMILQSRGVNPGLDEKWDPRSLPKVEDTKEVSRGETLFGIVAGIVLLSLLVVMPERIGVYGFAGGEFYSNPVILQYLPWIYTSLALGIGFNIYLLWQGQRTVFARAMELGLDIFSIVVVTLLYKGHAAWLQAHGESAVLFRLQDMAADVTGNLQVFGMKAFAMAFGITLIVLVSVTIASLVKMIINALRQNRAA